MQKRCIPVHNYYTCYSAVGLCYIIVLHHRISVWYIQPTLHHKSKSYVLLTVLRQTKIKMGKTIVRLSRTTNKPHRQKSPPLPLLTPWVLGCVDARIWGLPVRRSGQATTSSLQWRRWLSQSTRTITCASASGHSYQTKALTSWTSKTLKLAALAKYKADYELMFI